MSSLVPDLAGSTVRTTFPAVVGLVLAARRKAKPMTQAEMAEATQVTTSTWSRIETGETALTVEQLALAAEALGTRPSEILRAAEEIRIVLGQRRVQTLIKRSEWDASAPGAGVLLTGSSLMKQFDAATLKRLVTDAGEKMSSAAATVGEAIDPVLERAGELANDAGKKVSDAAASVGEAVRPALDKASEFADRVTKRVGGLVKRGAQTEDASATEQTGSKK